MGEDGGRRLRMGFALDIAGYGARTREPERDAVVHRLQSLVASALNLCGLALSQRVVPHYSTGDGMIAMLPGDIDPVAVFSRLVRSLSAGLDADNERNRDRIRLRMSVAVGVIECCPQGFAGPLPVELKRLLDAAPLRSALLANPAADLAIAISDHVHAMVLGHGFAGIPAEQFSAVHVAEKEFAAPAWIWISSRQWVTPAYLPVTPDDPVLVGGYRILARLGRRVYVGRRAAGASGGPSLVAIKVFDRALAADPDALRELELGVLGASMLGGPSLAEVVAWDTSADHPWVASTLVRGPSLTAVIAATGPLPGSSVGWLALDVARAIGWLNSAGHGDGEPLPGFAHHAVTPANVLLAPEGAVLTDFGSNTAMLTHGQGNVPDDVLQFAITVCYAGAGRSPWDTDPDGTVSLAIPAGAGEPNLTGCPDTLAGVLRECLDPDPARRPPAGELERRIAGLVRPRPRSWLPAAVTARLDEYQRGPASGPR